MRLAFYTYSYTERLDQPIGDCLKRIAECGYSGIDVSATFGESDDPKSFDADRRRHTLTAAKRNGLRIEAVVTHAELTRSIAEPDRPTLDLLGSIEMAGQLDADTVLFHMGGYHEQMGDDELYRLTIETIQSACRAASPPGIRLAVDGIWPTWIDDSPDALDQLFNDVARANFGVNFDPCYLTLMGVDPAGFVDRFIDRIVHAHLKDHVGRYPNWTHHIPGRGDMDYTRVFAALARNGFEDAAAVECFMDMPFEQACTEGYADMTEAAAEARITFDPNPGPRP